MVERKKQYILSNAIKPCIKTYDAGSVAQSMRESNHGGRVLRAGVRTPDPEALIKRMRTVWEQPDNRGCLLVEATDIRRVEEYAIVGVRPHDGIVELLLVPLHRQSIDDVWALPDIQEQRPQDMHIPELLGKGEYAVMDGCVFDLDDQVTRFAWDWSDENIPLLT